MPSRLFVLSCLAWFLAALAAGRCCLAAEPKQAPARRKPVFWKVQVVARSLEPAYLEAAGGREVAVAPASPDQCAALVDVEFEPTFSDSTALDKKLVPLSGLLDERQMDYMRGKLAPDADKSRQPPLPASQARLLLSTRVCLVVDGKEVQPKLTSCPDGPGWNLVPAENIVEPAFGKPVSLLRYVRTDRCTTALIASGKRNAWTFVYIVPRTATQAELAFEDAPPQTITFRPLDWQPDGPAAKGKESAMMLRELLHLTTQATKRGDWQVAWRNACLGRQLFPTDPMLKREFAAVRPEGIAARVLSVRQEAQEVVATVLWMLLPGQKPPAGGVLLAHFGVNNARPDDVWKGRTTLDFRDGTTATIGSAGVALTMARPAGPAEAGAVTQVKFPLPRPPKMEAAAMGSLGAGSVYVELSTAEGDAGKALSPALRAAIQFDRSKVIPNRRTIFD